jgi:hypothetical protein
MYVQYGFLYLILMRPKLTVETKFCVGDRQLGLIYGTGEFELPELGLDLVTLSG